MTGATLPHIHQLVRSNRKTIALVVTRDGHLVVRAPLRASRQLIEAFVLQKVAWIEKQQRQARCYNQQALPHTFVTGETFLYLGRTYPLRLVPHARPALTLAPESVSSPQSSLCFLLSAAVQSRAHPVFIDWYRAQARLILQQRIDYYSALTGLIPTGLKITSARTRWGSCSTKGMVCFAWRLILAPLPVVDYVVVHELLHLREKNHARQFWDGVAAVLPAYKQQMAWLKANGHLLIL